MRFLTHILTLAIGTIVIWFAIVNRHQVDLKLDPLPLSVLLPLYLPVFVGVLLGLVAGGVISWRTSRSQRSRLRVAERERDELKHSLHQTTLKDQQVSAARDEPTAR